MSEPRESIVSLLLEIRAEEELSKGATEQRARSMAELFVNKVLQRTGGRPWYHPLACTQTKQAMDFRDDAIRLAHSSGATYPIIRRSFRVSRGHFYRIIHGKRNGHGGKVA